MTQDYNARLAKDYEDIRDRVERGMLPLVARIPAIDDAVSEYVAAQDAHFDEERAKAEAEGRSPNTVPIQLRDERALHRFADLILYEELTWSHADKMTIVEYPIMSDRQAESRRSKQVGVENIEYNDRQYNGRRANHFYDKQGRSRVTKPRMVDAGNDGLEAIRERIDAARLISRARLSERQKEALQLVYSEGLTQSEAAEAMGVAQPNVNAYIRAGIKKLKKTAKG